MEDGVTQNGGKESRAAAMKALYRGMAEIRAFEERVRSMSRGGLVPGLVHLYSGQEAVAVGVSAALEPDDVIASHHRGHGHCLARGADPRRLFAEILGRATGYGMGRGTYTYLSVKRDHFPVVMYILLLH